jgi:hypothetical protein
MTRGNPIYGTYLCHHPCVWKREHRRLYREAKISYFINDEANPTNHPIYVIHTDLGSNILQLTDAHQAPIEIKKKSHSPCELPHPNTFAWKMFFDGASSKEGVVSG